MSRKSLVAASLLFQTCLAGRGDFAVEGCFRTAWSDLLSFTPACSWREDPSLDISTPVIETDATAITGLVVENRTISQPWSLEPTCVEPTNGTEQVCIFTSLTFAGGRGISVVTTPSEAELIAETAVFKDKDALELEGANEQSNPSYEARALPGRGIGLIANATLHRGDRIFSHTPVLVVNQYAEDKISKDDLVLLQQQAVSQLPEKSKEMFMALHGHFGGDRVNDIIATNSFDVEIGNAKENLYAVLPETSRLNHDCRPNAHYYLDPDTLTHHVHALKDIHPGEELTISYIDSAMPREDRLEKLKRSWGFDCNCSRCTQPRIFTDASDARLELIVEVVQKLEDYDRSTVTTPHRALTDEAELLVSLVEQERMYAVVADAYVYAALEYSFAGNKIMATKYASLGFETSILYNGPKSSDTQWMLSLWESPEEHWSWLYFAGNKTSSAKGVNV